MNIDPREFPADVKWLEIVTLVEDGSNRLTILVGECGVEEAQASPPKRPELPAAVAALVERSSLLEATPNSRFWRIAWPSYVGVLLLDETFATGDPAESYPDNKLRRLDAEPFMAFSRTVTSARDDYPGPLELWELVSLNTIVQVVSTRPPEVEQLTADELADEGVELFN